MGHERNAEVEAWRKELLETIREDAGEVDSDPGRTKAATATTTEVLVFEVGGERYGLDIRGVAEILLPREPTPLPRVPSFVDGLVSLRGTVLPVLSMAGRLGVEGQENPKHARIVVLRDGEDAIGFRVDRVAGVLRFEDHEIETNNAASCIDPRYLRGIGYDRQGNLVALLSADSLCDFSLEDA